MKRWDLPGPPSLLKVCDPRMAQDQPLMNSSWWDSPHTKRCGCWEQPGKYEHEGEPRRPQPGPAILCQKRTNKWKETRRKLERAMEKGLPQQCLVGFARLCCEKKKVREKIDFSASQSPKT